VKLTTHLHPVPRSRMSAAPQYVFMAWTRTSSPFRAEEMDTWIIAFNFAHNFMWQWLLCCDFTAMTEWMVLGMLEVLWTFALFCCDWCCTALPQSALPPHSNSSVDLFWNRPVPTATPFMETWELDDDCVAWIWMNGKHKWWWWHITLYHNW
jgi:hypothetical protein